MPVLQRSSVDLTAANVQQLEQLKAEVERLGGEWEDCTRERSGLRAEVERLKRLLDQRGKDAADAEDEVERMREIVQTVILDNGVGYLDSALQDRLVAALDKDRYGAED